MFASSITLPRRYAVLRELGRGGEGSVLLVKDALRGGALLALKVFLGPPGPGKTIGVAGPRP